MDQVFNDLNFAWAPTFRQRPNGVGRNTLRKHQISIRHVLEPSWPRADRDVIERNRKLYDAGLVEMCQGRDGNWMILYAIPRKKPAPPRRYFFEERQS